ncbi:2Fe-2S iron-sulfur cluster binding domain-containing protein [Candidatus Micrarchaeota archaeon]|nr:2Fe-2S iron-sulfur cluster binding domain-containing protein [Candidatus Micrarchaeota archaeon]
MATVEVKNDGAKVEVADGTLLAELDGKCSILFACKTASCGSCKVRVVEGMENLEAPNDLEQAGLATFGTDPTERLMCVCTLKKGKITVEY